MLDMSHAQSPLRLVKVGMLSLSPQLRVISGDEAAAELMAVPHPELSRDTRLVDLSRPAEARDVDAAAGPAPFNYLGLAWSSAPLLVHARYAVPGGDALIASVTSINEYLVEAHFTFFHDLFEAVHSGSICTMADAAAYATERIARIRSGDASAIRTAGPTETSLTAK